MNNPLQLLLLLCALPYYPLTAQTDVSQLSYIQQYRDLAVRQMQSHGIPASIILAQGLLESNAGRSELATNANNQFGIKCGEYWTGRTYDKTDDDYDVNGQLIPSCFRAYPSVEASFEDHSNFLSDPIRGYRYRPLFLLEATDYQGWAHGLQRVGYATSSGYAQQLIRLIERYNLHQYDEENYVVSNPVTPSSGDYGDFDPDKLFADIPSEPLDLKLDIKDQYVPSRPAQQWPRPISSRPEKNWNISEKDLLPVPVPEAELGFAEDIFQDIFVPQRAVPVTYNFNNEPAIVTEPAATIKPGILAGSVAVAPDYFPPQ
jgi:hypothetical protein